MHKIPVSIPLNKTTKFVDLMNKMDFTIRFTNDKYDVSAKSLMVILSVNTENQTYIYAADSQNDKYLLQFMQEEGKEFLL